MKKLNKIVLMLMLLLIFTSCNSLTKTYTYDASWIDKNHPGLIKLKTNEYVIENKGNPSYIETLYFSIGHAKPFPHSYKGDVSIVEGGYIEYKDNKYKFTKKDWNYSKEKNELTLNLYEKGILIPLGVDNSENFSLYLGDIKIGKDRVKTYPFSFSQRVIVTTPNTKIVVMITGNEDNVIYRGHPKPKYPLR